MYDDAKQIIAFVFTRGGKPKLTDSEMYLTISMDLQWCSPKIAKDFVSDACFLGLLIKEGHHVMPSFNLQNIEIPLGFCPTEIMFYLGPHQNNDIVEQKKQLDILIERLKKKTSLDREQLQNMIQILMEEKQLNIESATAMLARSYDVVILDVLKGLKDEILKRN